MDTLWIDCHIFNVGDGHSEVWQGFVSRTSRNDGGDVPKSRTSGSGRARETTEVVRARSPIDKATRVCLNMIILAERMENRQVQCVRCWPFEKAQDVKRKSDFEKKCEVSAG